MPRPHDTFSQLRTAASIAAAALGTLICIRQSHFPVTPRHPLGTIDQMTNHRCGMCLLVAMFWMFAELFWLTFIPSPTPHSES